MTSESSNLKGEVNTEIDETTNDGLHVIRDSHGRLTFWRDWSEVDESCKFKRLIPRKSSFLRGFTKND